MKKKLFAFFLKIVPSSIVKMRATVHATTIDALRYDIPITIAVPFVPRKKMRRITQRASLALKRKVASIIPRDGRQNFHQSESSKEVMYDLGGDFILPERLLARAIDASESVSCCRDARDASDAESSSNGAS